MKQLVFYILVFCAMAAADAQTIPLNDSIPVVPGSNISSDNMGNLFITTPTNDVIKYDKDGKKMATANFKVLGNITSIDVSNPFEIYIFYRDQNRVIFLDNLLNLRGECDLESIGVSQIACLGRSADNQIWLFDVADLKLKKYSKDLKLLVESASFNTFNAGTDIYPTLIRDINNAVFMLDQNKILEFDIFANFNKIRLIDTLQSFQYINEKIVFLKKDRIFMFNPVDFSLKQLDIQLPLNTKNIRIEKERLFVLTDEYVILQTFTEK